MKLTVQMGHFRALQPPFFYFIDLLFSNKTFYLCVHTFLEDFHSGEQPPEPTGSGKKIRRPHPSFSPPPCTGLLGTWQQTRNDSQSLCETPGVEQRCLSPLLCSLHSPQLCSPHRRFLHFFICVSMPSLW